MTSKAALFALLAMWGVGTSTLPARAEEPCSPAEVESEPGICNNGACGLVNRVWSRVSGPGEPEVMRIFLSDGILVSDSSWGRHEISRWAPVGANCIHWDEDGIKVTAQILRLSDEELVLRLIRKGGAFEERYLSA